MAFCSYSLSVLARSLASREIGTIIGFRRSRDTFFTAKATDIELGFTTTGKWRNIVITCVDFHSDLFLNRVDLL